MGGIFARAGSPSIKEKGEFISDRQTGLHTAALDLTLAYVCMLLDLWLATAEWSLNQKSHKW